MFNKEDSLHLLPDRHPNRDFFQCDILDATPKGDMASMEHPIFSLSTKPDTKIRLYEHNGNTLKVVPSAEGIATIWDKDILIYCISQLVEGLNRERFDINRTIHVIAYDYFKSTNKGTCGRDYQRFQASLERLSGTRLVTNISTNGVRVKQGFGLIDKWKIVEKSHDDTQMIAVEITLSEWLYNAVLSMQVKSMNRDYFRLRKGLERRLYELARKHCGNQFSWKISIEKLLKKSGSKTKMKDFKHKIKAIVESNHLPDYRIIFDMKTKNIVFYNRSKGGRKKQCQDIIEGKLHV